MATSVSRRSSSTVHPTRQQLDDLDALLKRMLDLPFNRLEEESDDDEIAAQTEEEVQPPPPPPAEPMRGPHHPAFNPPTEKIAPAPVQYTTTDADEADLKPRVIMVAPNASENATNATAGVPPEPPREKANAGQPEDWVPLTSSWQPSPRTWKPLTEAWQQAQGDKETRRQEDKETGRQGEEEKRQSSLDEPMVPNQGASNPPLPVMPSIPLPPAPVVSTESAAPAARTPMPEATPWFYWPLVGFNAVFDLCLEPWGPTGRWLRGPAGRTLLGFLGMLCLTVAAAWAFAAWIGWTS